jgi:DNA polymerase-3 subunit epsilon/CBS domain-containing protein
LFVSEGRSAAVPAAGVKLDTFAYRHRVSDVMSAPAAVVAHDVCLDEAVGLMIELNLSSVFVRLEDGSHGIVTERDALRVHHEHAGEAGTKRVGSIAKAPLLGVEESDFVFRAIGRMERLGIRHLAVRRGSEVVGALTPRNLLRNRATQSIVIGDAIAGAETASELASCWAETPRMARALLAETVSARLIANVLSADICGLTQRAAELAEHAMRTAGRGAAPAAYCVLVLGSAGRGESLLAADQDNAIVFEAGEPGGDADRWFAEMAGHMNEILDQAGIPLCKGGVMARNDAWRRSRHGWDELVTSWVRRQKPEDLLNVDIFFDAVAVHGNGQMADDLLARAGERARHSPDFLMMLTELARQWRAPFTLLGGFQKVNGRVDCKKSGLMPIFTGARVLALRHGVAARSTQERLKGVQERGAASPDAIARILEAQEVLMRHVLQQQIIDGARGVKLSPNVDVDRLGKEERRELKDALQAVREIVDLVSEGRL